MAKFRVTAPDGSQFEVTAPDNATDAEVTAYAQKHFAEQTPKLEKPAAVKAGETLSSIPRQLGLTARYALEGPAQMAEIATEPLRKMVVNPLLGMFGTSAKSTGSAASSLADTLGLPKPEGANERVFGDMARFGFGGAGMASAARAGAGATSGLTQSALNALAANPTQQIVSAAGAGGAGGAVREAGGGPGMQAAAALAGGVTAPLLSNAATNAGRSTVNALRTALTPQKFIDQQVDQALQLTLKQQGIDYAGLSERIKQGMRAEAQSAITNNKPLDPAAVARMLEFQRVPGTVPTRGMISQDPVQITREKNLAKIGANSVDIGLQKLPGLESSNTRALLSSLDDAGAMNAPDSFSAGQQAIGALESLAGRNKANIDSLYQSARDTSGRSLPLNGAVWTARANQLLDDAMIGGKLPSDVASTMNRVAKGEMPFTVEIAEQIKTRIGDLQRASSDKAERMALGIVRGALDDTPLLNAPVVNAGNLPAVPGTVPPSPSVIGQESIDAFNKARAANRAWMQQVEKTPALKAVVEGVEPDQFVRKFIVGQGATVADVNALKSAASGSPEAMQAIKQHLVSHLRGAATGQGSDINKFRAESYNNALNSIGERKLSAFFSPDEIAQLRAVGKTANYMTAQPAGSAVNNSNSGALVAAKALDMLDAIAGKMPLGLDTTIQGVIRGTQQRQAMNVSPGLMALQPKQPTAKLLGMPAVYGGLLASQPVNDR